MASPRRIAGPNAKNRAVLLDAAERLMLDEGYAAVSSRRVAAAAGLKPQLVHYYFRTMDDLFVEVFRRRAERDLAGFERAIAADGSLRNLWRLNADPHGAAFTMEFVALANHRLKAPKNRVSTPLASLRGFRRSAESAGESVSALKSEMRTEIAIVTANCLFRRP